MFTREKLLKRSQYWITLIQNKLFQNIHSYIENKNLTQTEMANKMGVSKGYLSQILNGNFDHKLSKLVELSLAVGKVPLIEFYDVEEYVRQDKIAPHGLKYKIVVSDYLLDTEDEGHSFNIPVQKRIYGANYEDIGRPLDNTQELPLVASNLKSNNFMENSYYAS